MHVTTDRITDEAQLAAICRQTLKNWPNAKAAVLFGSRARGDHRPDSDWDVAVIIDDETRILPLSETLFPRAGPIARLHNVDSWVVSQKDMHDRLGELGVIPGSIARDGHRLAGYWTRPSLKGMTLELKPEKFEQRMNSTLDSLESAINQFTVLCVEETWPYCLTPCNKFLKESANAAEFLIKAIIERRGVPADKTHNILSLVSSFAETHPNQTELIRRMEALNGYSKIDNQAPYGDVDANPESYHNAVQRIIRTIDLWVSELKANPDGKTMAGIISDLARRGSSKSIRWMNELATPLQAKSDDGGSTAMHCTQAILDRRDDLRQSVGDFEARLSALMQPLSSEKGSEP